MPPTRLIHGLRDIADRYALALCDIWGVVHNGHAAFPDAIEALVAFRGGGGGVVLISNAPRPSAQVETQLKRLQVPSEAWDVIVTSGDATRSQIAAHGERRMFHVGPDRDRPIFQGIPVVFALEDDAEVVVCTGLFDDLTERAEDYRLMLERFLARGLPLICANPDLVVQSGDAIIDCAGAVADLYERMGGQVTYCGKPYKPIYDMAFAKAESLLHRSLSPSETLAIGDSVRTDLSGAKTVGCDSLFIAAGIHGADLADPSGQLDADRLTAFLAGQGVAPAAALPRLVW